MDFKKRTSSTIPFGYKFSKDKKLLIPNTNELERLNEVKKLVLKGKFTLRFAASYLQEKTNRKISHVGLRKILDSDYLKSKESIKNEKIRILEEKNRVKEKKKQIIKEQKKKDKEKRKKENYLKMLEKQKLYRQENKEKIRRSQLIYQNKNKEKLQKYREKYYQKNKDKILVKLKEYSTKNVVKRKKYYLMKDNDIKKTKKSLW